MGMAESVNIFIFVEKAIGKKKVFDTKSGQNRQARKPVSVLNSIFLSFFFAFVVNLITVTVISSQSRDGVDSHKNFSERA